MQKNGDAVEELQDIMFQLVNDMIYFSSLMDVFCLLTEIQIKMKIILKFSR